MRLSKVILLFVFGVLAAQTAFYFPSLPDVMATHFNAAGIADNWMSKISFVIFEAVIILIIAAQFTILPVLIEKMPDSLINLPNKNYWLAAERRAQTFSNLRIYFEWFGAGLLLLLVLVNQQVYKANLTNENLSAPTIWLTLGGFVIFLIVWMIKFFRQFKIKE